MTTIPEATHYRVLSDISRAPRDHIACGFPSRKDLLDSLSRIITKFGGRVGESIATRHSFRRLRFTDTIDGYPEEEWIPDYLLERTAPPLQSSVDERDQFLTELFGFDMF